MAHPASAFRPAAGNKAAAAQLQSAAGVFSLLREVAAKAFVSGAGPDATVEAAAMLTSLCLAQAQECFFDTAMAGGKSASICAKIAKQVCMLYEDAGRLLREAPLKEGVDKGFVSCVALKAALYNAEACRLVAAELGREKDVGPQIARLQQGLLPLAREVKAAKGAIGEKLWAASQAHEAELRRLLAAAERENECVYMTRVPAAESLPPLQGALLVKPAPMAPVLDAGKERLLRSIVPDDSAKAVSRYSELVDTLIRQEAAALTAASDAARVRLRELELPGARGVDCDGGDALADCHLSSHSRSRAFFCLF